MTYSIVARDPETGELGVAVQSHFFAVGSVVSWAEAGAGAVATQSVAEPALGRRGLGLMRDGASAPEALHRLIADDPQEANRQLGLVDRLGSVAVHTGGRCIGAAGHRVAGQASAQANMMRGGSVPDAMVDAYGPARGDRAARLMAALEAAERAGGDIRGRQSAALVVVGGQSRGGPALDTRYDLRVDDHDEPVSELRRLLELKRAYDLIGVAEGFASAGDMELALEQYQAAHELQPGNPELAFWHGVALAAARREREARGPLGQAFAAGEGWRELLERLPAAGLLPDDDPELVARLSA